MAVTGKDLLQKLKQRYREVEFPSDAEETLQEVYKFFSDNLVANHNDATHQVLGNYSDWWDSQSATQGPKYLAVSEDYHVDELRSCMAKMYELGAPLTLGEKRTNEFTLMQEIEIRGAKGTGKTIDPEDVVGPKSKLLELIGKVMAELYPSRDKFHVFVLDGSGQNHHVGVPETFIRLVWGKIIVDKTRAFGIMDTLLKTLQNTDCTEVKNLEREAKLLSEANTWKGCFKDRIYAKADPIRMVFNDSVSDPPLTKLEHRPLKPLYIYEFNSKEGQLVNIETLAHGLADFNCKQWAEFTTIRQNGGTDLTPWEQPKGLVARPQINGYGETSSAANGFASGRQSSGVRMRSQLGSPNDKPTRGKTVIEDRSTSVQRLFVGNVKEFVEQMKTAVGDDLGEFKTDDNEKSVVWTNHKSGTKVDFREANQMVTFSGKDGSVRQLLTVTTKFLSKVPDDYTGMETNSRAFTARSYSGSKAPSKVFENQSLARKGPTSVSAISIPNKPAAANNQNGTRKVPYQRKVTETFDKEDQGELQLDKGVIVTVTDDPEADGGDLDRWVLGELENGETGWFPLGYTMAVAA